MVYLERYPQPPLSPFVESIWYTSAYRPCHRFERVFPSGRIQLIINLAGETIANPRESAVMSASLVVGVHSGRMIIDTTDLQEMMGVEFRAAGFHSLFHAPAYEFADLHVPLDDLAIPCIRNLRTRLQECATSEGKLQLLESELIDLVSARAPLHPSVAFSLAEAPSASRISEIAKSMSISQRRFTQVFSNQVGTTPKHYFRISRFQQTLRLIRANQAIRWAELALDCGYFDQSHFVHDFVSFSGITPGEYVAKQSHWLNHVPA